jgi:hypothetical protein
MIHRDALGQIVRGSLARHFVTDPLYDTGL